MGYKESGSTKSAIAGCGSGAVLVLSSMLMGGSSSALGFCLACGTLSPSLRLNLPKLHTPAALTSSPTTPPCLNIHQYDHARVHIGQRKLYQHGMVYAVEHERQVLRHSGLGAPARNIACGPDSAITSGCLCWRCPKEHVQLITRTHVYWHACAGQCGVSGALLPASRCAREGHESVRRVPCRGQQVELGSC